MVVPGSGVVRCARAAAWACAAGGLSVGAHVVGGGGLPSAGGAALLAVTLLWAGCCSPGGDSVAPPSPCHSA
ncbi:hypothetical protein [Janibacter hoylei]|uniref:hypothetical protein n=1 Tax=Janibacter hoylei TaxID=364298 RepID=UPI0021A265B0|nr:hypothetical protein [Janibacter hoylei]MCT1618644.1 hypothetical protein [Janibacter hoylei]MCT2293304.1 hypothetical protein [Janibacter hoylei]MCW4602222.1 hypothetical protein [Janibacter hoylei]